MKWELYTDISSNHSNQANCLWVTSFYIYSIIVYHSLRPCLEWRLKECQTIVLLTSLCVWFGGIGKELSIGTVEKHVLLQETKNELGVNGKLSCGHSLRFARFL